LLRHKCNKIKFQFKFNIKPVKEISSLVNSTVANSTLRCNKCSNWISTTTNQKTTAVEIQKEVKNIKLQRKEVAIKAWSLEKRSRTFSRGLIWTIVSKDWLQIQETTHRIIRTQGICKHTNKWWMVRTILMCPELHKTLMIWAFYLLGKAIISQLLMNRFKDKILKKLVLSIFKSKIWIIP